MRILLPPWGTLTAPKTLVKLISATGFLLSSATVFAQDPAQPDDLRYEVYSNTATEIFWNRATDSDGSVVGYEIQVNGEVIDTLDVLSYYFDNLVPNQTYDVAVTTIDNESNRSTTATVSFVGGDLSTPNSDDPPTPDPNDPQIIAAPTGLTATVYSSNSGEIFWDRPDTFGLTYEITRNGTIMTTTDGISYYDSDLIAGERYTYEVVAINLDGQRSTAAITVINTLAPDDNDGSEPESEPQPGTDPPPPLFAPVASDPNILEPTDLYTSNGYDPIAVLRVDLRTVTQEGPCNADDESGCKLDDVLADIDKTDDHTVDIKVHFSSTDFPDDGSVSNAELRLRGGGSRFAPQKSFRIKLDSKEALWRGERHLQINKHPFDSSRIRNKLAMDVMSEIPNLPSLRTQFVHLYIDDGNGPEDYGLFTHVERVNEFFLEKRGWNEDDNIYKAEYFRFTESDLDSLAVDDNGEPLDEDLFERTLEIENGNDHRMLVAMLSALHNPDRTFESVLDQYFDQDNVMAWIATNILIHQADAVRHNFILYNPFGTEKFYFVPWDYDAALGEWREPPNDLSNDSLRQRLEYGYALAARNPFLESYYRQPGIHEQILATVDNLRQSVVTDEAMASKANHYINLAAPFQQREPDSVHNPDFTTYSAVGFTKSLGLNAEAVRSRFGVLMAPTLAEPQLQGSSWNFRWTAAYDVSGDAGSATYRLQIATTPAFDEGTVVVDIDPTDETGSDLEQNVDGALLPSGQYFARLIATPANEPERLWQVSGNKLFFNNEVYYGTLQFKVP